MKLFILGMKRLVPRRECGFAKEHGRKGNFRVKFEIRFPSRLSPEKKDGIKRIFEGHV